MNDLRKAYRTATIIGLAMIAGVFIYAIIVELVKKGAIPLEGAQGLPEDQLNVLKYVLFGISAVLFFMIRVVDNQILSAKTRTGAMPAPKARGLGAAPPEHQRLVTTAVVSYALSEAPAIFGLVLFFLGRNSADFYVFMLISLFFFSYYFPKYGQWEEWVKSRQRSS